MHAGAGHQRLADRGFAHPALGIGPVNLRLGEEAGPWGYHSRRCGPLIGSEGDDLCLSLVNGNTFGIDLAYATRWTGKIFRVILVE